MSEIMFEEQLHSIATTLDYPPTPDIAGLVMTRLRASTRPRFLSKTLAWSLTIILIVLSSLMLIPSARAAIIEFIQIGVVRIFPRTAQPTTETISTATPVVNATRLPTLSSTPESFVPLTATSSSQASTLIPLLSRMAGETTLADAQKKVDFPILLPTYPSDLGPPDYVFLQNADGNMVVLVWLDPQKPDTVLMSLQFVPSGSWVITKFEPRVIQETKVNGQRAIWTEGPYPLILRNGDVEFTRLVKGNVLVWVDGELTYRLETDLSVDEAVKIAESLEPIH